MRRFHLLLGAALLLLASAASAGQWSKTPTGTTANCLLSTQRVCYYNFTTDNEDSPMLQTDMCDSVTILYQSDIAGTDTDAEANVRTCVSSTVDNNTCNIVYSDAGAVTLNGDPATGRAAIYDIVANWLYVDITTNADPDSGRVVAICER